MALKPDYMMPYNPYPRDVTSPGPGQCHGVAPTWPRSMAQGAGRFPNSGGRGQRSGLESAAAQFTPDAGGG